MFIQYAIEPFQGSEFFVALHPELHSGLFTLNHSVVFLGQRLGISGRGLIIRMKGDSEPETSNLELEIRNQKSEIRNHLL